MEIHLISYTGKEGGYDAGNVAGALMLFADAVRTETDVGVTEPYDLIRKIPTEDMPNRIRDIAKSWPSATQFLNLTFLVKGLPRSFLYQLGRIDGVKTVAMDEFDSGEWKQYPETVSAPEGGNSTVQTQTKRLYDDHMSDSIELRNEMLGYGVSNIDASTVLPVGMLIDCMVSLDMRTYLYMVKKRDAPQYGGDFKEIIEKSAQQVLAVYPWADVFFSNTISNDIKDLEESILSAEGKELQKSQVSALIGLIEKIKGSL